MPHIPYPKSPLYPMVYFHDTKPVPVLFIHNGRKVVR